MFKESTLMRVYACPQPPHILPKYVPPRLAIIEFFWQFLMMNKEMIPPSLHKPAFFCRTFKIGDFEIGKNAYEELSEYLSQYKFATPGEADELFGKYCKIRKVEEALRRTNPDFKGFYPEVPYPSTLKKMVANFDYIMSQMPHELEGEEATINRESPEPDVYLEVELEEEQPSTSAWIPKGNKRQKTMHVLERVVSRAL